MVTFIQNTGRHSGASLGYNRAGIRIGVGDYLSMGFLITTMTLLIDLLPLLNFAIA